MSGRKNNLFYRLLTEMHRVTSPPALEESPGVRLRPQACFEANRRKAALRPRWRIETPQRSLGAFRRWKVPRRRLLQKSPRRRAGTRFAYLGRRFPCSLSARAWLFTEPTDSTPHSLFVPPKRERAVDGTREKGGFGGLRSPVPPEKRGSAPRIARRTRRLCSLNIVAFQSVLVTKSSVQ